MSPAPLTRADALAAWHSFLPHVVEYAARRNHVVEGHPNVSRLSAALRYRLISEDEVITETLAAHPFSKVEKWLQEVCWRRYWKGWLEMRPDVWTSWRRRVSELRRTLPPDILRKAEAVAAGQSGVACMDAFAHELIDTGYLHNHARMWWASFWIHAEKLPWELGADFFFRHLLDADPASNTLSWRWVAGLQTPGKTYLVRLSNLEKYASAISLKASAGSNRIADGAVTPHPQKEWADTTRGALPHYESAYSPISERYGIWLHPDDLLPEVSPLAKLMPKAVAAFSNQSVYQNHYHLSDHRIKSLRKVLADGVTRAAVHYSCSSEMIESANTALSLGDWAQRHQLEEVVAMAPTVGPVHDLLPQLRQHLNSLGIQLTLIRRESGTQAFALAKAGFFPFWEKMSRQLRTAADAQTQFFFS
ncbi:MAG: DNA photolyase [Verrucomicrobia bacterium]|nr:DNA photolyase [Verrucomicrobiota bacterium]